MWKVQRHLLLLWEVRSFGQFFYAEGGKAQGEGKGKKRDSKDGNDRKGLDSRKGILRQLGATKSQQE